MVPICPISSDEPDLFGALLDILGHRRHGDVDATLQVHRVHAGGNELDAFLHD